MTRKARFADPAQAVAAGSLLAPMPGAVVAVHVGEGDAVTRGQPVLVLEAMKMQHQVSAPRDGVVSDLPVAVGHQVAAGEVLAVVDENQGGDAVTTMFTEPDERVALREAVARLAASYGRGYLERQARGGGKTTELWQDMGKHGYLGVSLPEEYDGGGGGIADLAAVLEEAAAAGAPLLLMVVSPAIVGTVISRFGTEEQRQRWVPGIADGSTTMAFAITEPDAGSNSHQITTTASPDENGGWVLNGRKTYISGVDEADAVLVVSRMSDAGTGKLEPALFVVPTDTPGFQPIPMAFAAPELQFDVYLDEVHVPHDALVGDEDAGLAQLFAGLNPERTMGAAFSNGIARCALEKAVGYASRRRRGRHAEWLPRRPDRMTSRTALG